MERNTLIKHKEAVVICEESGLVYLSYNALLTTLKANAVIKPIVHVVTIKSTLPCTNYGKTSHSVKLVITEKKEVPIMPTTTIKSIELVAKIKIQLVKLGKIHVHYPCIIYSSVEHRSRKVP
jgi:hypothetical protein